ncbi:hypothetical protein D9V37_17395 [Nocardioides mangrovicus]|uniref:DUF1906 domain-containing protein n=1 Tax=Nocardioides mangrovicus TaxID=2478913 RepID=A0A3L8P0I7_9ACTN|nr:hypothetical protein [Nocardioides mangrovicus]RLV47888.1 hypothetical protein D9V37_17395 [Nocardioides mangrovicus]
MRIAFVRLAAAPLLLAGCGGHAAAESPARAPTPALSPSSSASSPARSSPSPTSLVPSGLESIASAQAQNLDGGDGPVEGADVSWPQCPKGMGIPQKRSKGLAMPLPTARFVVLGLTNSPGFTANPCLASQVQWVAQRHLLAAAYSVVSYPDEATLTREGGAGPYDGDTPLGMLGNVGYAQARFNVATMKGAGLRAPVVWVDVEPVNDFAWSADPKANAAVVRGAVRGYQAAGYRVGVYSTQHLWQEVVGDLRLELPEWRAAGMTSRAEALRRCGVERMFQGGSAVMSQWVDGSAETGRDRIVTCPDGVSRLGDWFHQY